MRNPDALLNVNPSVADYDAGGVGYDSDAGVAAP